MAKDIFLPNSVVGVSANLLTGKFITDGEPVTASVANRIPRINSANETYLHDLLKRGYNTSGEFLWNQPIANDVEVGHFVYYDAATRQFEKALARYILVDGSYQEAETSAVWGLVIAISGQAADICVSGLCNFTPTVDYYRTSGYSGEMFLSDIIAGEPSAVIKFPYKCLGFLVGTKSSGESQFFVRIGLSADPRLHEHKAYELAALPAGNWSEDSNGITAANLNLAGWVPASHSVFEGKAPADAVYGYNPRWLRGCDWPLAFASAAGLRWQRKSTATDDPVLATVPPEFYVIDDTTIWWLTNVPPYLPWDSSVAYSNGTIIAGTTEDSIVITGESEGAFIHSTAPQYTQRIWLETINSGFGLGDSVVSSLRAEKNSGLHIKQYPFGGAAVSGNLEIGFTPPFTLAENVLFQSYAASDLGEDWEIQRTANVSGIRIDSTQLQVIESDEVKDAYHYGKITIGDPTGNIGRELSFEAIHLQGVEEAVEREAIGLAFPANRASSLLARITVPLDKNFDRFGVSLFFGILLTKTGTVAADAFKLSYRVISNPGNYNTGVQAFPDSQLQLLNCDFRVSSNVYLSAYYTTESDKLYVKPGDIILVKIERTPPDNFADRIILLRKSALLHAN
jgi:hypothetical protein